MSSEHASQAQKRSSKTEVLRASLITGVLTASATGAIMHECSNNFDNDDSSGTHLFVLEPSPTPEPISFEFDRFTPSESPIILEKEGPSDEALKTLNENVVFLGMRPKKEYKDFGFVGANCHGFLVRDSEDTPLLITARHCLDNKVNDKFGNTHVTMNNMGESIYTATAINLDEKMFTSKIARFFREDIHENPSKDVIMLSLDDPLSVATNGISLPLEDTIEIGDRLTSLQIPSITTSHFGSYFVIAKTDDGSLRLLSFPHNADDTCLPGASGSALVQNDGTLGGVLVAHQPDTVIIDEEFINTYNLSREYLGQVSKICHASPGIRTRELLSDLNP